MAALIDRSVGNLTMVPPPLHSLHEAVRMRIPIFSGGKGGVCVFVTANGNQYPRYVYPFPEIGGSGDGERA